MRTRTIYNALDRVYRGLDWVIPSRRSRQHDTFERELLRRCDERDTMRAELAEARAYISTVIDAPKDYPAEESA